MIVFGFLVCLLKIWLVKVVFCCLVCGVLIWLLLSCDFWLVLCLLRFVWEIGLVFGVDEIVICSVKMLLWLFILVIVLLF